MTTYNIALDTTFSTRYVLPFNFFFASPVKEALFVKSQMRRPKSSEETTDQFLAINVFIGMLYVFYVE